VLAQPIVFALILDRIPSVSAGRQTADRIGVALASYPQLPRLIDIEPRP
jgi:hypothetical protein